MELESLLVRNKRVILDNWFNQLVETYPADTLTHMKRKGDPFANPIGSSARTGLEAIFDELLGGMDTRPLSDFLDPIIRVRAVQCFTPSQAVGFIFLLKTILREVLAKTGLSRQLLAELQEFELRIDELALLGFNIYMDCREKLNQLREKELRNRAMYAFGQDGPRGDSP